jgi:formylglycine-generating enzyme required for sulfatase activity
MKFVLIPAGSFTMGSDVNPQEFAKYYGTNAEDFEKEQPAHHVEITKSFYLQTNETTKRQWKKIMGNYPMAINKCGDDCPVSGISPYDIQIFLSKLNKIEGTSKYRLPTEAEWEYACRAKTTTPFNTGVCISTDQANYNGDYPFRNCRRGENRAKLLKVGSLKPNAWGLFDMHGNIWETCGDWLGDYSYGNVSDPKGSPNDKYSAIRGGSWINAAVHIRSAMRSKSHFRSAGEVIGFRVARDF